MKKLALLAVFLILPLFAKAQTAWVVPLSPEDAAQAKALYAQKAALDQQIAVLHDKVIKDYLNGIGIPGSKHFEPDANTGWPSFDFEYSKDFKFIVPKAPSAAGALSCGTPFYFTPSGVQRNNSSYVIPVTR